MSEPTRVRIIIGKRRSLLDRCVGLVFVTFALLAVPVVNEQFLSGHWAVHIVGGLFGFMMILALASSLVEPRKEFESVEDAADWVRSEEWRKDML